jgi:hypothetical protein
MVPFLHPPTILDFSLDLDEVVFYILPADVYIAAIKPVVVDGDGVFLQKECIVM